MKTQALALGFGIGLLALFWFALQSLAPGHEAAVQPAAPLASQQQVTVTADILLTATVGTDECPNESDIITVESGTTVYYCYIVENTGNVTLSLHSLTDEHLGEIIPNLFYTLSPGAQYTVTDTFSRVITEPVTSLATWTAQDISQTFAPAAEAKTTIDIATPGLSITLTVGLDAACATTSNIRVPTGSTVYYCLSVENTGNITLTSHTFDAITPLMDAELANWVLPPAASQVITYEVLERLGLDPFLRQTIAQSITTTLTMRSSTAAGDAATESASAIVRVGRAAIDMIKTVGVSPTACPAANQTVLTVAPNQAFYYCLRLSNTGEIALTHHRLEEPASGLTGEFDYTLAPGALVTLTNATITSTPGLTFSGRPVLGPLTQVVTASKPLLFTSTNDENFRVVDVMTTTVNVSLSPFEVTLSGWPLPDPCYEPNPQQTLNIGGRMWYCLTIKNNSSVPLIHHTFTEYISPPGRDGARYAYTATTSFTRTLDPGAKMVITNALFTRTLSPLLPPIMGPYTVTAPLTRTNKMTNTVYVTSENRTTGLRLNGRSSFGVFVNPFTPTPTSTGTPTQLPTETPTPTPTFTPFGGPPTNTAVPTPTPISLSALASPTPTPNLFVANNVTTPQPQFQSPLGAPTPTPTTFISTLPTPTVTPDLAILAATQTADAATTATALATLFTATPTVTDTPTPTDTATPTQTATDTVTPTATQRPIEQSTATMTPDTISLFSSIVDTTLAAAGWIWFVAGSLVFFVTAGIVAGLSFRHQERDRYHLFQSEGEGSLNLPSASPLPSKRPTRPTDNEDEDSWPASLP